MPSHIIHLGIAQEVNKKLKLNSDAIKLGSVLPDLTVEHNHGLSHFQYEDIYPKNLANPDEFVKTNPNKKDDISIGYIIHLLTDRYYNNYYYNTKLYWVKHNKKLKHKLFESYDKYLLNQGVVEKINNTKIINNIPNYNNISFDKEYLKGYINSLNNEIESTKINKNYRVENQEFLDSLYNECIKYILNKIDEYI